MTEKTINIYLDDERPLPAGWAEQGWVLVKTAREVLALLETTTVHRMSLDHDLGQVTKTSPETGLVLEYVPSSEDGTWLVRQMIERNLWPEQRPVLHTMNPVGRKNMENLINDYWGRDYAIRGERDSDPR